MTYRYFNLYWFFDTQVLCFLTLSIPERKLESNQPVCPPRWLHPAMLRKRADDSQTLVEEGGLQKYFFPSFFNVKLEFTLFSICVTFNI